jgi:hypothetical protein
MERDTAITIYDNPQGNLIIKLERSGFMTDDKPDPT